MKLPRQTSAVLRPGDGHAGSGRVDRSADPDFCDYQFDFSHERVAIVGMGNVAVDVARILCRTPEELVTTDIADYALEALRHSCIKEVHMLGRRGPAQAVFTNPELKELGELAGADVRVRPEEVALDDLSRVAVEKSQDRATYKKLELLQRYAAQKVTTKPRRCVMVGGKQKLGGWGERALGFFHPGTGFWLMYLVFAAALNFVLMYTLPL